MKEVMAIVRLGKVNATKTALAEAGFPAFTCRKVMGRGKKVIDPTVVQMIIDTDEVPVSAVGECITEALRLIPKRVFVLMVQDEEVKEVVDAIMEVNSTGNPGDGKIFILPVMESYRVRDGEKVMDRDSSY